MPGQRPGAPRADRPGSTDRPRTGNATKSPRPGLQPQLARAGVVLGGARDKAKEKFRSSQQSLREASKSLGAPRSPQAGRDASAGDAKSDRPQAYSATSGAPSAPGTRAARGRAQPSRAATSSSRAVNRTSIWALVLSILAITSPIGLYLGYRSRTEIYRKREYGEPFARAAIWIGWLYVALIVLALIAWLWIAGLSS